MSMLPGEKEKGDHTLSWQVIVEEDLFYLFLVFCLVQIIPEKLDDASTVAQVRGLIIGSAFVDVGAWEGRR